MVAQQTSGAEVVGSNPASPTMILGRCSINVYYCKILRVEGETSTHLMAKNAKKHKMTLNRFKKSFFLVMFKVDTKKCR